MFIISSGIEVSSKSILISNSNRVRSSSVVVSIIDSKHLNKLHVGLSLNLELKIIDIIVFPISGFLYISPRAFVRNNVSISDIICITFS